MNINQNHNSLNSSEYLDDTVIDIDAAVIPTEAPAQNTPTEADRFAMVPNQPPVLISIAQPLIPAPPKKSTKVQWPDNVLPIVNAHAGSDRAATIYVSRVKKWVPEIGQLPKYSTLLIVGLLNGAEVRLVAYVNRAGKSMYVGDKLIRHNAGCRVRWQEEVLGRLPFKGEKLPLSVISITARNLLT